MTLDEFLAVYEVDDNEWWRSSCGEHQNWFEEAVDRWRKAETELARCRADATDSGTVRYKPLYGRCVSCGSETVHGHCISCGASDV